MCVNVAWVKQMSNLLNINNLGISDIILMDGETRGCAFLGSAVV